MPDSLERHIGQELLLPYILVDDLSPIEYARLIEQLPVRGPLQVYSSSVRSYPYGSAAAHVLGYVGANDELPASALEGEDLRTFHIKGTIGRDGLEKQYDDQLQGQTGGIIYRVDPAGFKIDPPLYRQKPEQGQNLMTSLDIDLQLAAGRAMGSNVGGVVALDIASGRSSPCAASPTTTSGELSPRMSTATFQRINEEGGWFNPRRQGLYPPGSTFKIITSCRLRLPGPSRPPRCSPAKATTWWASTSSPATTAPPMAKWTCARPSRSAATCTIIRSDWRPASTPLPPRLAASTSIGPPASSYLPRPPA
ncbi:MAG: hypothetical protein IPL39_03410 [Opitutaceae bacterium]|nr:hypothetical protein [Opitutaceae bacterium]